MNITLEQTKEEILKENGFVYYEKYDIYFNKHRLVFANEIIDSHDESWLIDKIKNNNEKEKKIDGDGEWHFYLRPLKSGRIFSIVNLNNMAEEKLIIKGIVDTTRGLNGRITINSIEYKKGE